MLLRKNEELDEIKRLTEENERLRRIVSQYSSIIDFAPMPIWLRGENMKIQFCNDVYTEIVETSPDGVKAQGVELADDVKIIARSAAEQGDAKEGNVHVVSRGERKLFRVTEIPIIGSGSQVGFAIDITNQERAESEVDLYISSQSDLLESSTNAMAIFGPDTRIKFFNNAYVKLWYLDAEWLESGPTYGEILEKLREFRRLPEQTNFPHFKKTQLKLFNELLHPTEEFFYLPDESALRSVVIPHALGGLLFVYEDVTDKLALERSYNTLIKVQSATLDNLSQGVAVFREDGRLRLSNPTFAELWNLDPETIFKEPHISELVEYSRNLYLYEGDWEEFKANIISMITGKKAVSDRIERKDGKVLEFSCTSLPDGATLVTYLDVTDSTLLERSLRDRNKALEEADRIKTEFLANVSYELRSPLTSILGFAEVLKNNYFGDLSEKQKEYVEGIHGCSKQLKDLIDDILDVASVEAGYMKLNPGIFDVARMLKNVLLPVKERTKDRKLRFKMDCSLRIGNIKADEMRLKQVMYNLLNNAIKFTPDGGEITLGADEVKEKQEVRFWVKDTGIGIPDDEQEAVFDKFRKAGSGKIYKSGTGLGLTLVKNFIELHYGRVTLSSELGKGTLVECFVPRNC